MGATTIGGVAPEFALRGTRISGGQAERLAFRLSEHHGSPVVLAFSDADLASYHGWDGLAADVWAFTASDAPPAGYGPGVYIVDPAGVIRWTQAGNALPSASEIRGQLLSMLPGPMGGTFQLPPPPG